MPKPNSTHIGHLRQSPSNAMDPYSSHNVDVDDDGQEEIHMHTFEPDPETDFHGSQHPHGTDSDSQGLIIQELQNRDLHAALMTLRKSKGRKPVSDRGKMPATIRLKHIPASEIKKISIDDAVELLEISNNRDELDTSAEADKKREENLREHYYSLTMKRMIKHQLDSHLKRQRNLGRWKELKYSFSMNWLHFKMDVKEAVLGLEPWNRSLKVIEGKFGSGVASYFHFLRRLIGMNVLSCFLILMFVFLPQLLSTMDRAKYVDVCEYNHNVSCFDDNCTEAPFKVAINHSRQALNTEFSAVDIFTGSGWFDSKELYYGAYTNYNFSIGSNMYYHIPLAYLLVMLMQLLICLVILARSLAKSYRRQYVEVSGLSSESQLVNKVFSGWDFAITNKEAAHLHAQSLLRDFKEYKEDKESSLPEDSAQKKYFKLMERLLFNLLALAILCGVGALIYFLLDKEYLKTNLHFFTEMNLAFSVTLITFVMPILFTILNYFEGYRSRTIKLRANMIRSFLLIAVMIGMLIYFWTVSLDRGNDMNGRKCEMFQLPSLPKNSSWDDVPAECWETWVGKNLYRLVLVDFCVWTILFFVLQGIRKLLYNFKIILWWEVEFDVAWQSWNLLYNQVICWVGAYFSPLIPLIIVVKMFLTFYIKKFGLMMFCEPPKRPWKANRVQTIFLMVSFLGLVLSMLGVGYIITNVRPSTSCGPFRGMCSPYHVVMCISKSFHTHSLWLGKVAVYIIQPGCMAVLTLLLCCATYYMKAIAKARFQIVVLLREQVKLEKKDKAFLLRNINLKNKIRTPFKDGYTDGMPMNGQHHPRNKHSVNGNDFHMRPAVSAGAVGYLNNGSPASSRRRMDSELTEKSVQPRSAGMDSDRNSQASMKHNLFGSPMLKNSPKRGADNAAFKSSPYKAANQRNSSNPELYNRMPSSSNPNEPFSGIVHQPPFQNLDQKHRRSSEMSNSAEETRQKRPGDKYRK